MKYSTAFFALLATALAATDDLLDRAPKGDRNEAPPGGLSDYGAFTFKATELGAPYSVSDGEQIWMFSSNMSIEIQDIMCVRWTD